MAAAYSRTSCYVRCSALLDQSSIPVGTCGQVRERERELRKEGRAVPFRVRLREGPIGVRITLGQPTINVARYL